METQLAESRLLPPALAQGDQKATPGMGTKLVLRQPLRRAARSSCLSSPSLGRLRDSDAQATPDPGSALASTLSWSGSPRGRGQPPVNKDRLSQVFAENTIIIPNQVITEPALTQVWVPATGRANRHLGSRGSPVPKSPRSPAVLPGPHQQAALLGPSLAGAGPAQGGWGACRGGRCLPGSPERSQRLRGPHVPAEATGHIVPMDAVEDSAPAHDLGRTSVTRCSSGTVSRSQLTGGRGCSDPCHVSGSVRHHTASAQAAHGSTCQESPFSAGPGTHLWPGSWP